MPHWDFDTKEECLNFYRAALNEWHLTEQEIVSEFTLYHDYPEWFKPSTIDIENMTEIQEYNRKNPLKW